MAIRFVHSVTHNQAISDKSLARPGLTARRQFRQRRHSDFGQAGRQPTGVLF
jgi:hypothetical protein